MKEFESLRAINNACSEYLIGEARYTELKNKFEEQIRADERENVLDKVKMQFLKIAKELAEQGHILSDEQYFSLMDIVNLD